MQTSHTLTLETNFQCCVFSFSLFNFAVSFNHAKYINFNTNFKSSVISVLFFFFFFFKFTKLLCQSIYGNQGNPGMSQEYFCSRGTSWKIFIILLHHRNHEIFYQILLCQNTLFEVQKLVYAKFVTTCPTSVIKISLKYIFSVTVSIFRWLPYEKQVFHKVFYILVLHHQEDVCEWNGYLTT